MSLARSFIKGDRWAFHHKDKLMACERCVWGTGRHSRDCTADLCPHEKRRTACSACIKKYFRDR
jgi:hypothetical protein